MARSLTTRLFALLVAASVGAAAVGTARGAPARAPLAQPGGWPTVWTPIGADPVEPGCVTHRNVTDAFYALDASYLYLRLENAALAGWPDTTPQGDARYKWFIDTNGDAALVGGSVVDAEYQLIVEDLTSLPDPILVRNLLGEQTLMDDLANVTFTARWGGTNPPAYTTNAPGSPLWRRVLGTGVAGTGGPQGAEADLDIGYRLLGDTVDMYVSRAILGDPSSIRVLWATDQQNVNLDQSPNCDRLEDFFAIDLATPTATLTATATWTPGPGAPTATPTAVPGQATATPTAVPGQATATPSPTPTPTPDPADPSDPSEVIVGGESLGSLVPRRAEGAVAERGTGRLPLALALGTGLVVAGSAAILAGRRRS